MCVCVCAGDRPVRRRLMSDGYVRDLTREREASVKGDKETYRRRPE